jgi:autotransporter-associated beta strand protein
MSLVLASLLHRVRRARFLLAACLASPALAPAQTWLLSPTNNAYWTAANWSTGIVPAGSTAVAQFGSSSITSINVAVRLNIGTLQFNADAPNYVLTFGYTGTDDSTGHHLRGSGIVNNSAIAPILIFQGGAMDTGSTTSLADAHLIFNSAANFYFLGQGGTATIEMNGGHLYFGQGGSADGQNARLILNGATLSIENPADSGPIRFGSVEGNGSIFLNLNTTLTVGQNNRDATFSGTLSDSSGSSTRAITKQGTGTWTLTGTNTSDAPVTITGGAIAADTNARLGLGGPLTLNGGAFRYTAAFDDLRALVVGSSGGSLDTQNYSVTHSTGISGTGTLAKLGSGTLTLSAANTLSGSVSLAAGTLAVAHDSALGTGTLSLDGGTLQASGGTRTLANAVTLNADTTISGSNALTLTGPLTLARSRELTVTNSTLTTISGAIGESGGVRTFTKLGSGTLELTGANTYTGGTLIGAGTVKINNSTGSAFGTGAVTVASGATLTGAGSFSGAFQNNGIYSPGNSPTLQTLSSFNQGSSGTLIMELGGLLRGTQYDALNVNGTMTFGGTLNVNLISGYMPASGASFNLFDWGSASGTFATLNLPALTSGLSWNTSSLYTDGTISVSAIPEPSTYAAIFGLAALGFAALRRRARPKRS